jgi:predicted dehydrogenase
MPGAGAAGSVRGGRPAAGQQEKLIMNDGRTLRGGLIGCGNYGTHLAEVLVQEDGVELVSVCDVDRGAREAAAERFGAQPTDDHRRTCDAGVDFVLVCSVNAAHPRQVIDACERGIAVFCEKPIATTVADGAAMVEAAERSGVVAMVDFPLRFQPVRRTVREMIARGELGNLQGVWCRLLRGYGFGKHPAVLHPERSGGWIVHHLIHAIDYVLWNAGPVREVYCRTNTASGAPSEETIYALLSFAGGAHGMIEESLCRMRSSRAGLVGSKASVEIGPRPADGAEVARVCREGQGPAGETEEISEPSVNKVRLRGPLRYFLGCVRSGAPPSDLGLRTGLEALRVAAAMQASAARRQPVAVDEVS